MRKNVDPEAVKEALEARNEAETDRFEGKIRASREQITKEWRIHFRSIFGEVLRLQSEAKSRSSLEVAISQLASKEADEIVDLFAKSIKGLTGRDMP